MEIGRKDIFWNYLASFLRIASSTLLWPLILRTMSSEMVGIWSIFITITAFASLLDFGFNPSFARNVTYIFSGVNSLKTKGYEAVDFDQQIVNYGLLKGLISSMRWFYCRISLVVFFLFSTLGTFYIQRLIRSYTGDHVEIYIAWGLLCLINMYNIYTLYYDSLLQGKGLIKRSKQIIIVGQCVYLLIATILILKGFGLIAIVAAQASSVIIIRTLSYRTFFTPLINEKLRNAISHSKRDIFQAIYPNALKIGLTMLGGFLVTRSAIIIGSFYLTLRQIASYGITMNFIGIIVTLAGIYTATYLPKIVQLRVENNKQSIKKLYIKGQMFLFITFLVGALGLLFIGPWGLYLIGSKTKLMPFLITAITLLVSFLEMNHSIAGNILLTKNEVPFFKASLLSGGFAVVLVLLFFNFTSIGLWTMIVAPGIAQVVYQNWKWPLEVKNELGITFKDIFLITSRSKFFFARYVK